MIRMLVVDDEKAFSGLVVKYFRDLGCEVSAVESAEAALQFLKMKKVDICVTDNRLPGMPGTGLLRRLRAEYKGIFIVMATIDRQEDVQTALGQDTADLFFKKPLLFSHFCDGVMGLMVRLTAAKGAGA